MKSLFFSLAWKESLLSITKIFKFAVPARARSKPSLVVYRDESNLRNALLTIRMALNPGEPFHEVAARIRREAADYEAFLRNPTKIGRIVLNVKEFVGNGFDACVSREQWRINHPLEGLEDPTEGRASVWYSFARSRNKVLEFVVHDEDDKPMFPLVRTYTNWIADKELDLGMNRKFYLTLAEGEAGYVNVRAGFTPALAIEEVGDPVRRQQPRAAACAVAGSISAASSPFYSLAFRQSVTAIAVPVVMLIMLLGGWVCFEQLNMRTAKANVNKSSSQANELPVRASGDRTVTAWKINVARDNTGSSLSGDQRSASAQKKETLLRLADIRGFKVSVDKKSCEGRCLKFLNGIQRQLKSRLDRLNLPPAAPESVAVNKPSANLVVSYLPLDEDRGKIHLALSDHEGSLWNTDHDFDHALNDDNKVPDSYSEQLSTELLLTVFMAKDHCLSAADKSQEGTQIE